METDRIEPENDKNQNNDTEIDEFFDASDTEFHPNYFGDTEVQDVSF